MSNNKRPNIKKFQARANLPKYFRAAAIFALGLTVLIVGIGFYRAKNRQEFRMQGFPTELSKEVTAVINDYERRESENDVLKYYIKADKATTFADNHQELENVFLQVFDKTAETSDRITAQKAVYIPAENKNFTGYFAGNVNIETRDALKVKTEQIIYRKETETAEAEELVEFERENIRGKSFGARVFVKEKKLELLDQVEINAAASGAEGDELAQNNLQSAKMIARRAVFDQTAGKIDLTENVFINLTPTAQNDKLRQPTDIKSQLATATFVEKELKQIDLSGAVEVYQKPTASNVKWSRTKANRATVMVDKELKRLELVENVEIETTTDNAAPTKMNSGYALYEKDIDRFDLKNGVHIVTTAQDQRPTDIRSNEAVYEQSNGKVFLTGGGQITQGNDLLKGDAMTAELFPNKKIKNSSARGNAYLKQVATDRTTEITANELNAAYNENQQLQTANAVGNSNAVLTPAQTTEYSKVTLSAPNALKLVFKGEGLLEQMFSEGRTTILMNAPGNRADAANKRLTADTVKTIFHASGKDLAKAEAVGNAELFVEPLKNAPENYKTTINAPRFDCEFFPVGSVAKNCVAATKTKTVRVPTVPQTGRGDQTLVADQLNARFNQQTQDIEQMDAAGNTKFTELDRNGIADRINFTAADSVVRLRGGEPTVWDNQARAKASEIDWDTRANKSDLRGGVNTTYYSQKQTGGATPFGKTDKPVYITAAAAEFDHRAETGTYTGNARAWQENNYVRADRLTIQQKQGQLLGDGNVQSLLYNAKRKENGQETTVPAYASSKKLLYNRDERLLRYEKDVDLRQGADQILGGVANIYLDENNAVSKTVVENNVVITQPKRRANGDYAQYNAADEIVTLRGNPARVEDAESGSSQGALMTVYLRENRVVSEGKSKQPGSAGRIRSVYKVKKS